MEHGDGTRGGMAGQGGSDEGGTGQKSGTGQGGTGHGGDDPPADAELDARGLLCPLPVLKARRRLLALAPGGVLRMVADDPAARVDVPHFCAEQGHALIDFRDGPDGALLFWLRRGGR